MFGRRQKPRLIPETSFSMRGSTSGGPTTVHNGQLLFGIANIGRSVARAIYLSIAPVLPYKVDNYGIDGNRSEGLPRLLHANASEITKYGGGVNTVIHPGTSLEIGAVDVPIHQTSGKKWEFPPPLSIAYAIAAEDVPLHKGTLTFSSEELFHGVFPNLKPEDT
jgi:hypothetical protein